MNNKEYTKLKEWLIKVDKKLDNHLVDVAEDITEIKTDLKWIKKFFWIVMTFSIGVILAAFFSIIIK